MRQGREQRFVETFIPESTVEAFDKPVLLRLPRDDIVSFDLHPGGPFQNGMGCEFRPVVADNHEGFAISLHQSCQFPRHTSA